MKKLSNAIIIASLAFAACNSGSNKVEEVKTLPKDSVTVPKKTEPLYACPMHPEVTGKKGDTCYKCSMRLTEVNPTNGN